VFEPEGIPTIEKKDKVPRRKKHRGDRKRQKVTPSGGVYRQNTSVKSVEKQEDLGERPKARPQNQFSSENQIPGTRKPQPKKKNQKKGGGKTGSKILVERRKRREEKMHGDVSSSA